MHSFDALMVSSAAAYDNFNLPDYMYLGTVLISVCLLGQRSSFWSGAFVYTTTHFSLRVLPKDLI